MEERINHQNSYATYQHPSLFSKSFLYQTKGDVTIFTKTIFSPTQSCNIARLCWVKNHCQESSCVRSPLWICAGQKLRQVNYFFFNRDILKFFKLLKFKSLLPVRMMLKVTFYLLGLTKCRIICCKKNVPFSHYAVIILFWGIKRVN